MLKKLIIASAVSGLMMSTALAQSNGGNMSNAPAKTPDAAQSDTAKTDAATKSDKTATNRGAQFVASQSSDQELSSKFIGTDVVGADEKKIGDVNDVLFDKSGKVLAYVVGVGGFLGIGRKDVAIAPASFEWVAANDKDDAKLKLSMTKDELKQAQDFKAYEPPRRSTVGSGGMSPGGGIGGSPGMTPGTTTPSGTR